MITNDPLNADINLLIKKLSEENLGEEETLISPPLQSPSKYDNEHSFQILSTIVMKWLSENHQFLESYLTDYLQKNTKDLLSRYVQQNFSMEMMQKTIKELLRDMIKKSLNDTN